MCSHGGGRFPLVPSSTQQEKMPGGSVWVLALALALPSTGQYLERAENIMNSTPVIDGHNDLPWQLLRKFNNQLGLPEANLTVLNDTHTNIPKLRQGRVGGQFWSVYVPCETQNKDAVRRTLEQMDVVQRMCDLYPDTFACVTDTEGIRQAFTSGKVASLMGVEGGHSIDSSLGVLRSLYRLGARYMTLTHSCNTPWADNWLVDTKDEKPVHHGLSAFGKMVVQEMNRLGMIVDLAHVSVDTMKAVLNISKAPIIFSHSSAYGICPHRRNVPDDVLRLVVSVGTRRQRVWMWDPRARARRSWLDMLGHPGMLVATPACHRPPPRVTGGAEQQGPGGARTGKL
ncbi:PREDICTED: dipeptidase 1 [Ficedula albicollis]|uniref:dipeptidase 1 n=1 Tax=Ficedula albicollis TaxID=59894 RepID=UPI0007AD8CA2|nr:PREDICTED: dipeptidase 1 [Ficedula albicollis]